MRFLACMLLASLAGCAQAPGKLAGPTKLAQMRVFLVGDSTMAKVTGYGDALCARFDAAVDCTNLARGGRSSKSYREEGLWDIALAHVRESGASSTYVLIQFGHNDQPGKPGRSTTLPEFAENMRRYVSEVRAAGAIPVLVTPLTRRAFKAGRIVDGLAPWAAATDEVAKESKSLLLDLHADSMRAVAAIGAENALALAEIPASEAIRIAARSGTTIEAPKPIAIGGSSGHVPAFDYTHLGPQGAALFSGIVADEIRGNLRGLNEHLRVREQKTSD